MGPPPPPIATFAPAIHVLTGSKSNQVARIGNSVCPVMAEAIVRAAAETSAKASKKGLWADPNPTPPWAFRKSKSKR